MSTDNPNEQSLAVILFQLFQVLEDRTITPKEGQELCNAISFLCKKLKPSMPKYWQRFLLDSVSSACKEGAEYFGGLCG